MWNVLCCALRAHTQHHHPPLAECEQRRELCSVEGSEPLHDCGWSCRDGELSLLLLLQVEPMCYIQGPYLACRVSSCCADKRLCQSCLIRLDQHLQMLPPLMVGKGRSDIVPTKLSWLLWSARNQRGKRNRTDSLTPEQHQQPPRATTTRRSWQSVCCCAVSGAHTHCV